MLKEDNIPKDRSPSALSNCVVELTRLYTGSAAHFRGMAEPPASVLWAPQLWDELNVCSVSLQGLFI